MNAPIFQRSLVVAILMLMAPALLLLARDGGAQELHPPGKIAFGRAGDIWVWQAGQSSMLIEDGQASDPRWSPSGEELLYVWSGDSYSDLILRYLSDGSEAQLTYNQPADPVGSVEYANNSIWAIDPAWSPSGLIAFASDYFTPGSTMTLWLIPDLAAGPVSAAAAQDEDNIEGVTLTSEGSVAGYTVREITEDGGNSTYVALRDLSDGVAYLLAEGAHGVFDPAIAPNNQDVAVSVRSSSGVSDIWIVDRGTRNLRRVTTGAEATSPCWSPDGRWLAYVRMVDFAFEIWVVPVTGPRFGEPVRLAEFRDLDAPGGLSWTFEGG